MYNEWQDYKSSINVSEQTLHSMASWETAELQRAVVAGIFNRTH